MKSVILTFSTFFLLAFTACSSDSTKSSTQNAVSAEEEKEIVKMDSLSQQLDKASSEIDKKSSELEDALKDLEN